jgi:phage recombination protein Bet
MTLEVQTQAPSIGFDPIGDALEYVEKQRQQEWDKEKAEYFFRAENESPRYQKMENAFYANPKSTLALEAAVNALNTHINRKVICMSTEIAKSQNVTLAEKFGYTESQLDLVKRTVAKNATDDELELFFYRAKILQLNPLMPGQIYFIKYGNAPGTIIIGIDGFRARAHATGKLSGCERGIIRNDKGVCTGAWANIYRSDWTKPAHEEVSLAEYNTGKGNWLKMPETMVKKVAEAAALRLAFPTDLGGLYISEEMDQAEPRQVKEVKSDIAGPGNLSVNQIKRMFAIAKSSGVNNDELKEILLTQFNLTSTSDMTREQYDKICLLLVDKATSPKPEENSNENNQDKDDFLNFDPASMMKEMPK